MKKGLLIFVLGVFLNVFTSIHAMDINLREYGVQPDGITENTTIIQKAIDDCSASGGGVVYFPEGTYLSGTFYLKDNVTLELHKKAVLKGIPRIEVYPGKSGDMAFVRADKVSNISIIGEGTIDGNGGHSVFQKGNNNEERPALVYINDCKNVDIRNIKLVNSAFWTLLVYGCEQVRIDGISIHGQVNWNNDGIDIDSKNVIVSNCFIDAIDDGICFKSWRKEPCENVTITNCNIASTCNPIKMGTQSIGGFKNITISNCVVRAASEDTFFKWKSRMEGIYAETSCIAGIALEIVDGGVMDQINISNITMTGVQTPIFIKLGARRGGKGVLKNVILSGITATTISKIPSSITGFPGNYVENVILRDIIIQNIGHGTAEDARIIAPENEKDYPENRMFGNILPSYGFFVRHVKNITFDNVQVQLLNDDARPEMYLEDVINTK
ncbi:exo-poly-alpha-D-galacturonosidase [Bacteroidia bacterium]|nr:exo-poly-alpha-D-galacturonosidase [Bacteroidia bacterium]